MALSYREKKLAVLWLADRAVINRLVTDLCPQHLDEIQKREQGLYTQAFEFGFTDAEREEIKALDLLIPKV